jgi:hypothetical protein
MNRTGLVIILLIVTLPTAFAQTMNDRASVLAEHVGPANPEKYRSVQDGADWKNPSLTVQPNGIEIRTNKADGPLTVPVSGVIRYLSTLPMTAWPYGLVVAVSDNGVRDGSKDTDSRIKQNRTDLMRRLHKAGVKAELWPSA